MITVHNSIDITLFILLLLVFKKVLFIEIQFAHFIIVIFINK